MRNLVFVLLTIIVIGMAIYFARENSGTLLSGDLNCRSESSTLGGYSGIGVHHTRNVGATLRNDRGNTIIVSERQDSTTPSGIPFTALFYFEDRVSPGEYFVDISQAGKGIIQTYPITLESGGSPMVAIFCQ